MKARALLLFPLVLALGCGPGKDDAEPKLPVVSTAPNGEKADWYRRGVFYELFVRSFQDSNGDGIGDFKGLTSRLDYLAGLGLTGLWLMPMYPSPLNDSGYDVADYVNVHPDYGTLADFDVFIREAHKRNLRVMLDLVFNHVSIEHAWFKEARKSKDNAKRDWFIWSDTVGTSCPDVPPSPFGSDRWTLDKTTNQYFFHQFLDTQADLNFENPEVQDALLDSMRFWLDRGVDGFRLDVPYTYFEGPVLCTHQPKTHDFLKRMRKVTDEYGSKPMVGEVWGDTSQIFEFYGSGSDELHMIFDFDLTFQLWRLPGGGLASTVVSPIAERKALVPAGGQLTVAMGNHDVPRLSSAQKHHPLKMRIMAALQLTLPGTPFLYYGEELGLSAGKDVKVDFRDWARAPMPWDLSANAGFTTGKPWLPLADGVTLENVKTQQSDPDSLLHFYKNLLALRNANVALNSGELLAPSDVTAENGVLRYVRKAGGQDLLIVHNFESTPAKVNVGAYRKTLWESTSKVTPISGTTILAPFTSLILSK